MKNIRGSFLVGCGIALLGGLLGDLGLPGVGFCLIVIGTVVVVGGSV